MADARMSRRYPLNLPGGKVSRYRVSRLSHLFSDERGEVLLGLVYPKLFPDVLAMDDNRLIGQSHLSGDLMRVHSLADHPAYLDLPRRETAPFLGEVDAEIGSDMLDTEDKGFQQMALSRRWIEFSELLEDRLDGLLEVIDDATFQVFFLFLKVDDQKLHCLVDPLDVLVSLLEVGL